MTLDIVLQIFQVLAVLLLAPLLQGFILKAEERVQRHVVSQSKVRHLISVE